MGRWMKGSETFIAGAQVFYLRENRMTTPLSHPMGEGNRDGRGRILARLLDFPAVCALAHYLLAHGSAWGE